MRKNTTVKRQVIGIIGGGSFGTALADMAAARGCIVRQWMRSAEQASEMSRIHENQRYLPGFKLNSNVVVTCDLEFALADCDIIFIAIPSAAFRSVVKKVAPLAQNALLVSTTKGIEAQTFNLMSEILYQEIPNARIGALSGPNFAKEILSKCITATVIASDDVQLCDKVRSVLQSDYFRVYSNSDRYGVELGGALKNIYAIVSGLAVSLKMGENTKSMLITRALAEMGRFGVTLGANPLTLLGLSGVGDLILTCGSNLSRNYRVGFALGQGKKLENICEELGQVVEGVNTLRQVREKALEKEVNMPIVEGLYQIIFEKASIARVTRRMMLREQITDVEFIVPGQFTEYS